VEAVTLARMPYPPTTTAAIFITFVAVVGTVAIATWLVDRNLKRTYARRDAERKATRKQEVDR
jgi:NhaP-type Na+/H+ or K+/H+ antiporter